MSQEENNVKKKRGTLKTFLYLFAFSILFVTATVLTFPHYCTWSTKRWKNTTVNEISKLAADQKWIDKEIETLKNKKEWLSEHMIRFENGDWLIYDYKCHKSDPRIKDIFLVKASDGKWYYTTCHFCTGLMVLKMYEYDSIPKDKTAPESLAYFIDRYYLEEFDGKSDKCLQPTKTFPNKKYE